LSTPRSIARGGESGAAVEAGKPDDSLMWQRIATDEMPPEHPLAAEERALISRWIAAGSPGLPSAEEATQAGPDHWAFVPPVRPDPPRVAHEEQVRNDIDRFILADLERRGWQLAREAEPAVLIRRVSIALTGLAPSAEEIALFLADTDPGAYERMVDRYLATPRYGERWGQHWLDAAGYADSNGHFDADSDRPLAYRYRDYVVSSFNADKPFDRFLQEQIAGDELVGFKPGGDVTAEMTDALIATHFLRNAPDGTGESDGNPDEQRADQFAVLEGTVQIVSSSLLGMTMQCARCHDHKFEPVTQQEYYQLQSILWPAFCPDDWRKPKERTTSVAKGSEREAYTERVAEIDREIKALRDELTELTKSVRQRLADERLASLDAPAREQLQQALVLRERRRSKAQRDLVKEHEAALDLNEKVLADKFPDYAEARQKNNQRIESLEARRPPALKEMAILFDVNSTPVPHHLLVRGDYRSFGPEVGPGVPAVMCGADRVYDAKPVGKSSGRRLALAQWLTDPRHPLLARVTVNRLWQHHFGRGIVASADNFGYTGSPPTHPDLLDYLAVEFIRGGWSTKAMHRQVLNSAVYRQSSATSEEIRQADPDDYLLARFPLLRLDAEAIRDSMLRASGELDLRVGGPYVPTKRTDTGEVVVAPKTDGAARRALYLQRRRSQLDSMLDVFDAPQVITNCTRRSSTTMALQSLSVLNSEFVMARAEAMAARLERSAGDDTREKIDQAFLLACSRLPSKQERRVAEKFLAKQPATYPGLADAQGRAWRDFCQMLLASNAFLYVE